MNNLWQACVAQLELELPPQQYSAWIKSLVPLDFDGGTLRIAAPNILKLNWVKSQYGSRITSLVAQHSGEPVAVQFVLQPKSGSPKMTP